MAMLEGTLWRCFDAQVGLVRMRSPSLRDTPSWGYLRTTGYILCKGKIGRTQASTKLHSYR